MLKNTIAILLAVAPTLAILIGADHYTQPTLRETAQAKVQDVQEDVKIAALPEFPGAKLFNDTQKPAAKKTVKATSKKTWTCHTRPLVQGWGDVKVCDWQ